MDKTYDPKSVEERIYQMWETGGYFTPLRQSADRGKRPFTILLPLPNANDPMHMGHALFTVEDIMIRYHRMLGDPTLWLPGGDHAGIETQFVFEKKLAKEGKSRFDFDRETLYQMISEFVDKNKNINRDQMKRLGFSLDWTRYHYSLEPEIVEKVLTTFIKLYKDNLVYRAERLANYCTRCGTAFSDLEINHVERKDSLYYIKYGPFVLATTRPETKFGDTAVAFHPGDKRYEKFLGQDLEIMGVNGPFTVKVVADDAIDPKFGTGIEKVTPAHDFLDFEIAKRHNLPIKKAIDMNGRLTSVAGRFAGMKVKAAREAVANEMQKMGLIDHIDNKYVHSIAVCYRCGTTIEPMLMPQWYVKTKPLAKPAIEAVKKGKTKIVPLKRFEKLYFDWMEKIEDWNISRQIVWGPRMPVWYSVQENPDLEVSFIDKNGQKQSGKVSLLLTTFSLDEIKNGLQRIVAPVDARYVINVESPGEKYIQETDTFDTWFLSGQWPVTTLTSKPGDFEYFYPTSVLDTLWDILFFWVARMMMFGLYLTGDVPFKIVHLHSRVVDSKGQKMSKSRGNVMNPVDMVDKYGADALRFALVFGVAPGGDIAISDDKVRGMRNFANKLWNIGRFITADTQRLKGNAKRDSEVKKSMTTVVKTITKKIDSYRFGQASELLYEFIWHTFADSYVEEYKKGTISYNVLLDSFMILLRLLHPFMPFVTEAIWSNVPKESSKPLIISSWPTK